MKRSRVGKHGKRRKIRWERCCQGGELEERSSKGGKQLQLRGKWRRETYYGR